MKESVKRIILSSDEFEFQMKVNKWEIKLDFSNEEHRLKIRNIDNKISNLTEEKIEEEIELLENNKEDLEHQINNIDREIRTKKEILRELA